VICGVTRRLYGDRCSEDEGKLMSEESLRQFLDQLNSDEAFVERLKANPQEVLAEFDLSPTERTALGTNDEDGLRRLAGHDAAGFNNPAVARSQGSALVATPCAQQAATTALTVCVGEQAGPGSYLVCWKVPPGIG
jgi:hypothetical protein